MTILFFARLFYPHIGGVETHVLEVGDRLARQGHKIILITEEISDDSLMNYQSNEQSDRKIGKIHERIADWEIHRIPLSAWHTKESSKKWKIWWWLWQHRELMEKADIIHCHDVFFWFLPFRFLYRQKPVFTTFHGYETSYPPRKGAITIRRWSERLSWGNICVGDFIKKWYGTHPNFVTYGGMDMEAAKKHQVDLYPVVSGRERTLKLNQKGDSSANVKKNQKKSLRVVFIGRLAPDTGILAYDQAISILSRKNIHNIELVVLGDGELRESLENSSLTASYEQNIYPYIKNAHIVFASSYLTILQALAMKKPVIAFYDNPLKEDYLKMSPFARWVFIENSSEKIARRVLQIQEEKAAVAKTVNEAYLWVSGQTWDNVTSLYLKLWKRNMH